VQDAQTIVVLAANQRAKSAFFMFSPVKTIQDASLSTGVGVVQAHSSTGKLLA
jgi:hypothetical protein